MKDSAELLIRIIAHENKHIESMRLSLKEDELTILRLQNKSRSIENEIEEHKQLIDEYRGYLRETPEASYTEVKLITSSESH